MSYELPTSVTLGGAAYEIRSDYRAVIDIMTALSDAELTDQQRGYIVLDIFYPGFENMPEELYEDAVKQCFWFINGGEDKEEGKKKSPRLVDWEMDFSRIVGPVNRVMGTEVRAMPYLHWWSFLSAYMEIGDCLFAQIVNIRNKKARKEHLDKSEAKFYRENRQIIDIKSIFTDVEQDILKEFAGEG